MQEQNNDEDSDVPKDRAVVRIPYLNKMKGMLRRIFLFAEPTIIIQYNYNITHEMSFFGPIINNGIIVDQSLTNIYNDTNCYDKDEAEDVECEEVKVEPKQEAKSDFTVPVTSKDYSNSPLKPLFTHPEQANFILDRMHRIMDYQTIDREKIKYLKAVCEHEVFVARIPYKDYAAEFGSEIKQPRYSVLMNDGGKYSKKELNLAFKCVFS